MPFWENIVDKPDTVHPSWIVRAGAGYYCGYVEVPREHPGFGIDDETLWTGWFCQSSAYLSISNIHGGLNYHSFNKVESEVTKFLVGFDCNHACDFNPFVLRGLSSTESSNKLLGPNSLGMRRNIVNFRTLPYVRKHVLALDRCLSVRL